MLLILLVVSSFVCVALTYLQLAAEDHRHGLQPLVLSPPSKIASVAKRRLLARNPLLESSRSLKKLQV